MRLVKIGKGLMQEVGLEKDHKQWTSFKRQNVCWIQWLQISGFKKQSLSWIPSPCAFADTVFPNGDKQSSHCRTEGHPHPQEIERDFAPVAPTPALKIVMLFSTRPARSEVLDMTPDPACFCPALWLAKATLGLRPQQVGNAPSETQWAPPSASTQKRQALP